MRRRLAFLPMACAGLSLALVAGAAPPKSPTPPSAPSPPTSPAPVKGTAGAAAKKVHTHGKHRSQGADAAKPHPTLAAVVRNWGDPDVVEGSLGQAMPGAVCPSGMANIDDRFCIDRWEGSLVEVMSDGREVPWPPFGMVDTASHVRAVSVANVYPQAYISGAQAARACAGSGKRLCAPVEWRKACMGPANATFGYGTARVAGKCNDSGQSPMLRLYPQVAQSWTLVGMTEMNDPRLNQLDATLSPTGSHDECTNDYGVFDMVGNLHEWTNDPNWTFQGGYYLDTHKNGDGCSYRTVAHEFTYHDYSTGFRCCSDAVAR
jgi:sulfatase-modifying factor enzyme 1